MELGNNPRLTNVQTCHLSPTTSIIPFQPRGRLEAVTGFYDLIK